MSEIASSRGNFSSSLGFVMAAAGSAVGLANIWGFPSLVAQNGGAAFLLIYLLLTFLVGFPLLMAELALGRYARSNPVGTYQKLQGGKPFIPMGFLGIVTVSLILSFYSIVAGKMIALFLGGFLEFMGMHGLAQWITQDSILQKVLFTSLFFVLTLSIISGGVKNGIEKWSNRFMPSLVLIMILLISYVLTQQGAMDGLKMYLVPDFNKAFAPSLLLDAMGQAFFSLSLAVGGMLVFAGYTNKEDNLLKMGVMVTLADIGIAFLAGLLIIPAMYVAQSHGSVIYDTNGNLLSGPNLIFQVLPELFNTFGNFGALVAATFFLLMTLAALTSSIAMLEVPTCYLIDNWQQPRKKAALGVVVIFWMISMLIVFYEDILFNLVLNATTKYSQPLLGLSLCLFVGWVMNRNILINELVGSDSRLSESMFISVWPYFVKYVCPIIILLIFVQVFLN
jgi:NSS family neurotransmitter:Na+ symporter